MRLGLFNWTSDLSDEPEYPPFFNLVSAGKDQSFNSEVRKRCLVDVIYGNERKNIGGKKIIGMIEYIGRQSFDTLTKSFGKEEWYELANAVGSRYDMILTTPVFVLFQSPEDLDYEWFQTINDADKTTLASNDFYYWPSYGWWICINRKWNSKLVEMLETKNPDVMEDFAKCRKGKS